MQRRPVVLILGASGFLGRHLTVALESEGWTVRRGSRAPDRQAGAGWIRANVLEPQTLLGAMEGADVVVNLVHLMAEPGNLVRLEQQGAIAVREAAAQAGVGHVVYLGGPRPEGPVSPHLAARLATGDILRNGPVATLELRAAMIVGTESESFRIVRDLALRLPLMALPHWLNSRSRPVGLRDVVAALQHAVTHAPRHSRWYELPGPERLSAEQVLMRVAAVKRRRPLLFRAPMVGPRLSSVWLRLVTDADATITAKLVAGLQCDLCDDGPSYFDEIPGHQVQPLDEAIHAALAADKGPSWAASVWERVAGRLTPQTG